MNHRQAKLSRGSASDVTRVRATRPVGSSCSGPVASRAHRDAVHPAVEPGADDLARPTRILLTELLAAGLLTVELIDLPDAEEDKLADRLLVTEIRQRWRSAASPLVRAARAA